MFDNGRLPLPYGRQTSLMIAHGRPDWQGKTAGTGGDPNRQNHGSAIGYGSRLGVKLKRHSAGNGRTPMKSISVLWLPDRVPHRQHLRTQVVDSIYPAECSWRGVGEKTNIGTLSPRRARGLTPRYLTSGDTLCAFGCSHARHAARGRVD